MRVIGLTGGVGAGKSCVLKLLEEEYQAQVMKTDEIANELMEPGKAGYEAVVKIFGSSFLKKDGEIDRGKLAKILFEQEEARRTVNGIIHPMVWKTIKNEISASQAGLIVVESAIMDSAPSDLYDEIWYVAASEETRSARLRESRGYTDERIKSMMKSQPTKEEFERMCSRVIRNDGTIEDVRLQLKAILKDKGQGA